MASLHLARMFRYISLTLVAALSYAEIDALPDDARGMLQVELRVGPVADPASYTASVSWGQFSTVHLDDIYCSSEAFLFQPYRHTLCANSKANLWLALSSLAVSLVHHPGARRFPH